MKNIRLVKYGADWCHGCKVMDKILGKVLPDFEGSLEYNKVDMDALSEEDRDAVKARYGKTIPILALIGENDKGEDVLLGSQIGAKSISNTASFLRESLPG